MKNIYKKIKISYTFILVILLSLISGLFKDIMILFLIIMLHEIGHIISSRIYNWQIDKITFSITGGYITYNCDIDKPFKEEFIISISGFIMQIIIFIISYIFYKFNIIEDNIYYMINNYNTCILLFNMLPIYPLDGSKILNVILNMHYSYMKSIRIMNTLSLLIITIIIIFFMLHNIKIEYSYIMVISILIKQIYINIKNEKYLFYEFLFQRYKSPIKTNKYNYVKDGNLNKFKRGCKNFFYINGAYKRENEILSKMFD